MPGVRSAERANPRLWAFRAGAPSRSNYRMHATADTTLVFSGKGAARRVMPALDRLKAAASDDECLRPPL